jgi:hypothetical protein
VLQKLRKLKNNGRNLIAVNEELKIEFPWKNSVRKESIIGTITKRRLIWLNLHNEKGMPSILKKRHRCFSESKYQLSRLFQSRRFKRQR